ncbi:MAG: restriction endonuclease subunit S [Chitinophagaceae bacterium]|nr:restriction endonuclease subunit S [Chitinophagaceae bacterium]
MKEWKEYKFSDVLIDESISYGIVQPGFHKANGIPIVRVNNIKNGYISTDEVLRVDESVESKYQRTRLGGGELLITVVGSVGECAIVPSSLKGWNVARAVSVARIKSSFDTRFIKYCFRLDGVTHQLYGNTNDTVQPTLNLSLLKGIVLNLPPLPTQTAIAEILSSLDDKIDLLHRQNKTLEQLAETLFRNESEKWKVKSEKLISFGELIKPKRGKNITKENAIEGEFPVVAGGLEPSCYHNESNTLDTVITISSSGANAGFVRLYQTPVWASDCSYIDKTATPYVYFSYVFLKINQQLLFDKQEGSAQPHVYPSHVMELEISDFPKNLIAEFEEQVSPFFEKIKSNSRQIRTLTQLRDTLLPKLMSGEIQVSEK